MDFLYRNKALSTLIIMSLFCIICLAVESTTFTLSFEGIGSAVTTPFQKGYYYSQKSISLLWAGFTELGEVREELQKTRDKLQRFEKDAESLNEIKKENERLRNLLSFSPKVNYETIPALIISKDPDNWFRTIIINRGSNDGIAVNMPVVAFKDDEKAIVGKVIEVRGSVSRVLSIISPEMKMGVMLEQNRTPGLMEGYSSSSGFGEIDYITKSAQVVKNERVVTSGQGGVFPMGILVGTVEKTIVTKSSAFQRAIIKPYINYNQVEEVFVIIRIPDKEVTSLLKGNIK